MRIFVHFFTLITARFSYQHYQRVIPRELNGNIAVKHVLAGPHLHKSMSDDTGHIFFSDQSFIFIGFVICISQ